MAWDTESKADEFSRTRLRLTFIFIAGTQGIVFLLYLFTNLYLRYAVLYYVPFVSPAVAEATLGALERHTFYSFTIAGITSAILIYFLMSMAIKPMKNVIDMQRIFIADASHELRTPLSIIKTDSEISLLNKKTITREEALDVIESNLEEINRMSNIIRNLLLVAHYNDSRNNLPYAELDLSHAALRTVKSLKETAENKKIDLTVSADDASIIHGNMTAIEELVLNIVKNAIIYTPEGGKVEVSVKKENNAVILSVKDTGIGIDSKDIKRIFEPFYKAHRGTKLAKESSGLGLSIVKEIAARHKGKISVYSYPERGTLIAVKFPAYTESKAKSARLQF